jgi:Family of unknown function (DUF6152)
VQKKFLLVAGVSAGFLIAGPAFAHHGTAGYDMAKVITLTGTATKVDWTNPHIVIYMDAKDKQGTLQHWTLELSAPLLMQRFGWTKDSVKAGDQVVAETHPAKNGAPVGTSGAATFVLKVVVNGTALPVVNPTGPPRE